MIQKGTFLRVNDNSGAALVECIHVYRSFYALPGDLILVSVKKLRRRRRALSKVRKGNVCKAVVTRVTSRTVKKSDFSYKSFENSSVLLNRNLRPIGSRVFGPVSQRLRQTKFIRVAAMARGLIR